MEAREVALSGGVTAHVETAGSGPAVLLLHAGVADRHMWDRQWDWLQKGFRTVRWDWRGFGDTPHVPGPFSYANDVIAIMDALDISMATIIGCSFGGATALQVAIQHPQRVERLVLSGPGVPGYEGENPPEVDALFEEAEKAARADDGAKFLEIMEKAWLVGPAREVSEVDPQYLERARELLLCADRPDNGAESTDLEFSAVDALPHLDIPVLGIVGLEDVPDILDAVQYLGRTLPQVQVEEIEGAAHLPNMEKPRQFDAILSDWLAATGESARSIED